MACLKWISVKLISEHQYRIANDALIGVYMFSVFQHIQFNINLSKLDIEKVDSVIVTWKDGNQVILNDVNANQSLVVDKTNSTTARALKKNESPLFKTENIDGLNFVHKENPYAYK